MVGSQVPHGVQRHYVCIYITFPCACYFQKFDLFDIRMCLVSRTHASANMACVQMRVTCELLPETSYGFGLHMFCTSRNRGALDTRLVDADGDDAIVCCARHSCLDVGHNAKLAGDGRKAGRAALRFPSGRPVLSCGTERDEKQQRKADNSCH